MNTHALKLGKMFGKLAITAMVFGSFPFGAFAGECVISSFYASPSQVDYGQATRLNWQASPECGFLTISPNIGHVPQAGSFPTAELYAPTTFTIYANGDTSFSKSISVFVMNSPYETTTPETTTTIPNTWSVVTAGANNIDTTSVRLNGILKNGRSGSSAYFEYGTTTNMDHQTSARFLGSVTTQYPFYDYINTKPGTHYYFRAVVQYNNQLIKGGILSFTSASEPTPATTTSGKTTSPNNAPLYDTGLGFFKKTAPVEKIPGDITIEVKGQSDVVNIGDTTNYTIIYTNNSPDTLTDATLTVILPQGFSAKQASSGRLANPNTLLVEIGTIAPGKSETVYLEAYVENTAERKDNVVTTATLAYKLPNGTSDSAVGYDLADVEKNSSLGGLAFGSGFFPTTVFGWLMTILIILALVIIVRRLAGRFKKGTPVGHNHDHHDYNDKQGIGEPH